MKFAIYKLITAILLFFLFAGIHARQTSAPVTAKPAVPYPEGYRSWTHVKSTVVGPANPRYKTIGGFQHIYANAKAMIGYETGDFPEGSTIAFDWLTMNKKNGIISEGSRRQLDVMMKDSVKFAATGGWGFQRFVGNSKTKLALKPTPHQCFACHQRRGKEGLVLSRYKP